MRSCAEAAIRPSARDRHLLRQAHDAFAAAVPPIYSERGALGDELSQLAES